MWWKFQVCRLLVMSALAAAQDSGEVEFDCTSVLSYAFFSLEEDCSQFVFCNDGEAEQFECGNGEIWSQENGACVLGDKETCEEWNPELACGNYTDDRVVPYPRDCGKYIQCGVECVKVLECEPGMIFSELRSECIVGSLTGCESLEHVCDDRENDYLRHPDRCDVAILCNKEEITTESCPEGDIFMEDFGVCVPGGSKPCEPLPLEEMCVNRTDQIVMHPNRCQSFVKCQNGVPYVEDCPRGMIFLPRNETCVVGKIGEENSCELLDQVCVNATVGEFREHSADLCDVYVECLEDEIPAIRFCASGRIWSQQWLWCVPGNRNNCQRSGLDTICDYQPFGAIFPHPEDCSMIVRCNLTHSNEIACPTNHIVQPGTLECILGDPNTCETLDDMCANHLDANIPIPNDCESYIHCRNEQPNLMLCPPGEIFVETLQNCTPGDTELCQPLNCEAGFARHPNYCNLFFDCEAGQVNINICPYRLIWHQHLWHCTPGSMTNCAYEPLETMCIGRYDGDVFPDPTNDDTCDSFVTCKNNVADAKRCPSGMILRRQFLDCVPGDDQTCDIFDLTCAMGDEWVQVHPSKCNVRIICSLGEFSVISCPEGQIVNEELMICVPGLCPEPNPVDTICVGLPDGELVPDLDFDNCVNFYVCRNELAVGDSCPEGNIFHRAEKVCIPGVASTCEDLRDFCEGKANRAFPFPEDGKCNLYIECSEETTAVSSCGAGLIFIDENTGVCVPGSIPECGRLPVETMCQEIQGPVIYPHPDDCIKYVVCESNQPLESECPRGNVFSGINARCLAGESCLLFDGCASRADGTILPHPTLSECDLYVECMDGLGLVKACPEGHIITTETDNECVPGDQTTCLVTPEEDFCAMEPDGTQLPHHDPTNCVDYYGCDNHVSTTHHCPKGTIFHNEERHCVPGIQESFECIDLRGHCLQNSRSIVPYSNRCDLFLACSDYQTTVHFCPAGEIFLESKQMCVTGKVDECLATGDTNQFCTDRKGGKYPYPNPHLYSLYVECTEGQLMVKACSKNEFFDALSNECVV